MKFNLSPKQNLVLWHLLITGDEPAISKVRPKLTLKERKPLVDNALIELVPRDRAKHMVLTDKAWAWASEQQVESLSESKYATPLLLTLINKVQQYLQANNGSLAEFLTKQMSSAHDAIATQEPVVPEGGVLATLTTALTQQIQTAYHNITEGKIGVRVRLADLRKHLLHSPKEAIDAALRQMQLSGQSVLMPLDDPKGIHAEDEEAAVNIGGDLRHIVYLKG